MKATKSKKSNRKVIKKVPNNRIVVCVLLRIGDWKKEVPYIQRRLIIAESLNTSIAYKKGFKILGYLIARNKVILVLESKMLLINAQIRTLETYIKCRIEHYLNRKKSNTSIVKLKRKIGGAIFHHYPLYNNAIFHLITGRVVDLKYYSPRLERLKDILHGYDYCSVKDYHCRNSVENKEDCNDTTAVKVELMPFDFWNKHLERQKEWDKNDWVIYKIREKPINKVKI